MADPLGLDDEGQNPLFSLWQQAVFEPDIIKKLDAVDSLISALDDEMAKEVKAKQMKDYIHKTILSNEQHSRKLEMFRRITENAETAIEYFGQDYITHPEFHFDTEFWNILKDVRKEVNNFIGQVLKRLAQVEQFEL